jgi:VWFA-related protein
LSKRRVVVAVCVAMALGASAWAQVPAAGGASPQTLGTSTLHVESKLVSLDVVVTDDKGVPVAGLGKDDFTVYEDNKPQVIRNFDSWEKRPAIPATAAVDKYGRADWGDAPLAILVLDEISTEFADSAYAADRMKKYLKDSPEVLPVPTMLLMVTDQGYRTLSGLTRDRAALIAAVDRRPASLPGKLARGDTDSIMIQTFLVLQQIALAEAGLKQHKSIIWVGAGFPGLNPDDLDETSEESLKKATRQTVDLLMETHTTVYKIDPVPTSTSTSPSVDIETSMELGMSEADLFAAPEDPLDDNFNFNTFAVQTGGQYFYGMNDLDRYFRRAIEQTNEYYTLTYRPPAQDAVDPETYRKVRVTVNKPGLHVVTRQGFYSNEEKEAAPTNKELSSSLSLVATSDMMFTGVGLRVVKVEAGKTPGTLSVTYQIEDKSLQWTDEPDGKETAEITAVLADLDAQRKILGSKAYKLKPFLLPAHAGLRFTAEMTARSETTLTPKTASVRLIVRDSSGRIGTASISAEAFADVLASVSVGKRK